MVLRLNGNPVKIKGGTMVTADPDRAKKELDKRKKIRLAQVRQQSSEIAAKVRKNVQKERDNQLSEIERKGAEKLERWKVRKLFELQEHYCDSLKNMGLGHAEAAIEETREEVVQASKDALHEKAKQRGYQAAKKLHRKQEDGDKNKPSDSKKTTKSAEGSRKTMRPRKSPFKRKKTRKKTKSRNTSENRSVSDSDFKGTEHGVSDLDDDHSSEEELSVVQICDEYKQASPSSSTVPSSPRRNRHKQPVPKMQNKLVGPSAPESLASKASTTRSPSPRKAPSPRTSPLAPRLVDIYVHHTPDTRISDRIKSRRLPALQEPQFDDAYRVDRDMGEPKGPTRVLVTTGTLTDEGRVCPCCCKCNCKRQMPYDNKGSSNSIDKVGTTKNVGTITDTDLFPLQVQTVMCDCCTCKKRPESPTQQSKKLADSKKRNISPSVKKCICQTEIPSKPKVVLKGAQKSKLPDSDKVQYYDHKNRFSKEYPPADGQVQRIPESDIEILPTTRSDKELMETMKRRDKEAQIRGKKASEKQKIQKDYKELMEKLPALQRQERIACISAKTPHNPAFHMGDSRLKQEELKKQCRMEDAYEKLFPHTITLKPKTHTADDKPFRVIDTSDSTTPTVCHWDIDNAKKDGVTVTKDDGVIVISPNVSDQTDNLKNMLEKLKRQKEMLLKEVETLPRDSNLNNIINDLEKLHSIEKKRPPTPPSTPTKSDDQAELLEHLPKVQHRPQRSRKTSPKQTRPKTSTGDGTKHTKKSQRIRKIILQNTSTQTSPKIISWTGPSDQPEKKPALPEPSQKEGEQKRKQPRPGTSKMTSTSTPLIFTAKSDKDDEQMTHDKTCKCCSASQRNDVCEIVIKIQDDIPEINIKSPKGKVATTSAPSKADKVEHKSVQELTKARTLTIKEDKGAKEKISSDSKKTVERIQSTTVGDKTESKLSWSKTLSYSPAEPSSSTSYYSPPDFPKVSSAASTENKNESLLNYIKQLLRMSRNSIENLTVSASDASLASTISSASDRASAANQALKILDLNLKGFEKHMNNTNTSTSTVPGGSEGVKSADREGVKSADRDTSTSNNNQKNDNYDNRLEAVAERYQSMADQCQQRISGLTAMIEQVRKEKEQMLSPSFSDKQTSTSYLNLPTTLGEESKTKPSLVSDYTNSESEQEQQELLNKILLDVQVNVEKTKDQDATSEDYPVTNRQPLLIDPEIYERYKNLLNIERHLSQNSQSPKNTVIITELRGATSMDVPFVPMMDIEEFPKLEHSQYLLNTNDDNLKDKKPPPAKGLNAAKKFNVDITSVPHELSTIVEVESQLSTNVTSAKKQAENIYNVQLFTLLPSSQDRVISEESMPDIVAEIKGSDSSSSTSTSGSNRNEKQTDRSGSSDMDNLETMLVSMGMGWAVATLRKTQEALVKAASSTSSDDGRKPKDVTDSSTSDITLRDPLGKKLFSTSTTTPTTPSMSPFIKELEEISAIQGSGLSAEPRQQRTSTPVDITIDKTADRSKKKDKNIEKSTGTDVSSKTTQQTFQTPEIRITSDRKS